MTGITLLLNAAEQRLQFGLVRDGVLLCGQDWQAASQGAELLAPALNDTLKRLGLSAPDIACVACVHGPGGFTGLRLVLSTASALHHALDIPLAGIGYLHLLAAGLPPVSGQRIQVLTNARRDLVYSQSFVRDLASGLIPIDDVSVIGIEALIHDISHAGSSPVTMIGSGVTRHYDALASHTMDTVHLIPSLYDQPHWETFLRLAENAVYQQCDLEPAYYRDSEAEDNLEMLAERRGDNPEAARKNLQELLTRKPSSTV